MTQSLTPSLRILSHASIMKVRRLPLKGEIFVKEGENVKSDDIIARAEIRGDLKIIKLSEKMGITPIEVMQGLKVKVGDRVSKKQLLCEQKGLFGLLKITLYSEYEGVVDFINEATGNIGIRLLPMVIELRAYLNGKVKKIENNTNVTIVGSGGFVQGIIGVGVEKQGILKFINSKGRLTEDDVTNNAKGMILISPFSPTIEAIKKAVKRGVVGLIVGSIDSKTLHDYLGYDLGIALTGNEDLPMTLVVTEGFGDIKMNNKACEVFKKYDGFKAAINGATQIRAGAVRPECIIFHDNTNADNNEEQQKDLKIGAKIKVIRVPYFSQSGIVIDLPEQPQEIATGAIVRVLKAKLDNGEEVIVPRANVELY